MVGPHNKIPEESTKIVPYNKMRVSINRQFFWNYVRTHGRSTNQEDFSKFNYYSIVMDVSTSVDTDLNLLQKMNLADSVRHITE